MTLVALDGTPLVAVGHANRNLVPSCPVLGNITIDAAKEAAIFIGRIYNEDRGSHTIDTTGSSSLGWRSGTVTFANAGTTVKVGLATVDFANGNPARAVNVSDVITFDVSKSMTGGGGGITSAAWQEHVPGTGTKTVAHGDLIAFAVQMTALGGADSVLVSAAAPITTGGVTAEPTVTAFTGAAYSEATRLPNAVITYSDGTRGYFFGGFVASVGQTQIAYNSGSATKEYGNFLQLPVPVNVYGVIASVSPGSNSANFDFVLYSDPLGTPVAQKTASVDANNVPVSQAYYYTLFSSPYAATASQPLAAIVKPTSANNVTLNHKTFNIAGHQTSETLGANGYAVSRASGAFAAQNSNKDRFDIGLLVGAFDNAAAAGLPRSRLQLGH